MCIGQTPIRKVEWRRNTSRKELKGKPKTMEETIRHFADIVVCGLPFFGTGKKIQDRKLTDTEKRVLLEKINFGSVEARKQVANLLAEIIPIELIRELREVLVNQPDKEVKTQFELSLFWTKYQTARIAGKNEGYSSLLAGEIFSEDMEQRVDALRSSINQINPPEQELSRLSFNMVLGEPNRRLMYKLATYSQRQAAKSVFGEIEETRELDADERARLFAMLGNSFWMKQCSAAFVITRLGMVDAIQGLEQAISNGAKTEFAQGTLELARDALRYMKVEGDKINQIDELRTLTTLADYGTDVEARIARAVILEAGIDVDGLNMGLVPIFNGEFPN